MRAKVFDKIVDIVIWQVQHGMLGFLLENVPGILRSFDGHPAYMTKVADRLQEEVPWMKVRIFRTNSKDHLCPQNRPRVYVIGFHSALEPAIPQHSFPPVPLPVPSLYEFVEKNLPRTSKHEWSPKQWQNITKHGKK